MSNSTCSLLVGKPQPSYLIGIEFGPAGRQHEQPTLLDQLVACHALDADGGPIKRELYLPGGDTCLISERFRDYQSPCFIYGSTHTTDVTIHLVISNHILPIDGPHCGPAGPRSIPPRVPAAILATAD